MSDSLVPVLLCLFSAVTVATANFAVKRGGDVLSARMVLSLTSAACVLPFAFMPAAERADVHYAGTLRDEAARPGQYVEFDRSSAGIAPDGTAYLQPWTQERIRLTGTSLPEGARVVSVRGRFDDPGALEVETLHVHAGRRRDVFTYLGLLLCLGWWSYAAWRRFGPKV